MNGWRNVAAAIRFPDIQEVEHTSLMKMKMMAGLSDASSASKDEAGICVLMFVQSFAADCRVLPEAGTKELAFRYCVFPNSASNGNHGLVKGGLFFAGTVKSPVEAGISLGCVSRKSTHGWILR
jgi:hypothetical protein